MHYLLCTTDEYHSKSSSEPIGIFDSAETAIAQAKTAFMLSDDDTEMLDRCFQTQGRKINLTLTALEINTLSHQYHNKLILTVGEGEEENLAKFLIEEFISELRHVDDEQEAIILDGPDNEHFRETWDDILRNAILDIDGLSYRLEQKGNYLWGRPTNR
jgi:hypothetical protein